MVNKWLTRSVALIKKCDSLNLESKQDGIPINASHHELSASDLRSSTTKDQKLGRTRIFFIALSTPENYIAKPAEMDSMTSSQKSVIIHLLRHAEVSRSLIIFPFKQKHDSDVLTTSYTEHKSNDSVTVDKTIVDPVLNDHGMEHCKRRCNYLQFPTNT